MFASPGSACVKPGSERSSERIAPSKSMSTICPGGAVRVAVSRYDFHGLEGRIFYYEQTAICGYELIWLAIRIAIRSMTSFGGYCESSSKDLARATCSG